MRRPAAPTAPGAPGERRRPSNCPHCDPVRSPSRALAGCGIRPSGGGSRPRGHAHKGRLPRGGSPRESGYQDWPAANDPQTPSVPGTKRPPGFGHPSDVGSRAFLSTAQSGPGTGARRMSRGSRARPLLDAPNPVDSLDDPTRDAARRPLESRNHGWDGRLPPFLKRGPTEGTCAPPVTERRPAWQGRSGRRRARTPPENHRPRPGHDRACKRSRVRIWLAGGPFCMGWSVRWPARPYKVGLSGSPVAWAARGLGHSRRAGRPSKPAPACPPVPSARAAHRSLRQGARARPISAAGSVCLSVYRDGWIGSSLAG
ncbi:hypothetical protein KXX56_005524 [Aspergillus fumigatus]|nr:hypothetical protein KXX56_005524 [Aspergillus fumigatus]